MLCNSTAVALVVVVVVAVVDRRLPRFVSLAFWLDFVPPVVAVAVFLRVFVVAAITFLSGRRVVVHLLSLLLVPPAAVLDTCVCAAVALRLL